MHTQKGYTLLELLVYIAILMIVMSVVGSIVLWIVRVQAKQTAIQETVAHAERAIGVIENEIREADTIYVPTSVFDSHPGQLSLETRKYRQEGDHTGYVDFFLCGEQLCWKREGEGPIALTGENTRVMDLVFRHIVTGEDVHSVRTELTIEYIPMGSGQLYENTLTLISTATLRIFEE